MRQESSLLLAREFTSAQLKRGLSLSRGHQALRVEPDSVVSGLYSSRVQKLLFGRGTVELHKVQAGLVIPLRQKETRMKLSPGSLEFASRPQEPVQVWQSLQLAGGPLDGYVRRVRVTNRTEGPVRVRLLTSHDPTSLNFRRERDPPGEIGVNAFNRGDHVVMDDAGDTTGARVVAFSPQPSAIYMTKDRQRASELIGSGELPDSTAGMSGAIIVITQHEAELPPGRSLEVSLASLYHDSSLSDALSGFPTALSDQAPDGPERGGTFACSNPALTFAYGWARAELDCIEAEPDLFERVSSGLALGLVRPARFEQEFESVRLTLRRDGLVPRTPERGGPLETSLFIINACAYLRLRGDKKLAKKWYPSLRKCGTGLRGLASAGLVQASASSPDGWRRRLGSGFPTGATGEVNLTVARALKELATLAYGLGKGSDSAAFTESGLRLTSQVTERLVDAKTGNLALNLDPKGRLHAELTADQAVALSLNPFDHGLASSLVHRLLEKDFESGYGPRCVPTSNALYYSPTYGEGQLGSCWTRGSLYHCILAYESGYPSVAGLQLEKVARLVHSDWEPLGGAPGEFPYWFDSERRAVMGAGSDPVAASLFVQAVLTGELGLGTAPDGVRMSPPDGSRLRWVMVHDLDLGERGSLFVGRSKTRTWVASSFKKVKTSSPEFVGCEQPEGVGPARSVVFWDRSSVVVCTGNPGGEPSSGTVTVPLNGKPLSSSLFAELQELDQETMAWRTVERRRLPDRVELRFELEASSWQAFRFTRV